MKTDDSSVELLSICINTYKRKDLLDRLLASLIKQKIPDNIKVEVIVVDNEDLPANRSLVCKFQKLNIFPIIYIHEPRKNISLARNAAVKTANGKYILFIDDDEEASPQWILKMYETLIKYRADAVFGPIISAFSVNPPGYIRDSFIFNRPFNKTGTKVRFGRTGNAIVKKRMA